jgi:predicted O-methyltransferase YrrM
MEHFFEGIDGWSSFGDQGELIKLILEKIEVTDLKIAEIGVYKGRCTAMWNVELINRGVNYEYFAIDHFTGSTEHNHSIDYYNITLENLKPIDGKVKIIKNDSLDECKNYPDSFFDVVYIDASHDYESVKEDILTWLPKVKKGGIICGDDYYSDWPGVIKAVNEIFDKDFNTLQRQWWVKII